jgi:hypothetical protein
MPSLTVIFFTVMEIACLFFNRLLKKAHLLFMTFRLRYASVLAAHVHLTYAPLLDPCDALHLNLFEQSAEQGFSLPCQ